MKKLYFLLPVLIIVSCVNQPDEYIINGVTSGFADSTMVYLSEDNIDFDSTFVIDNRFSFNGKVDGDYSNMWIHTKGYKEYKSIWVINYQITFDASNSSFRNARVTGSKIQDQSNEYENATFLFEIQMDSIGNLAKNSSGNDSIRKELRKQYESLAKEKQEAEILFIKTHPEYELSSFFLTFLKNDIEKEITKELYEGLTEKVKNTEWGETISMHIEKSVKLKLGDKAIDFTLPGINGKQISLSDFKGKYVLLEFWSSGCAPCRWENPNLLKAYKQFNDIGFEILGVSLDEKKSNWESTVKKDSIIWTTVSDLKGMSGEVPITYSVSYIPKNYLLNEEGIVIGIDLRGDKLQEELENIFRNRTNANK